MAPSVAVSAKTCTFDLDPAAVDREIFRLATLFNAAKATGKSTRSATQRLQSAFGESELRTQLVFVAALAVKADAIADDVGRRHQRAKATPVGSITRPTVTGRSKPLDLVQCCRHILDATGIDLTPQSGPQATFEIAGEDSQGEWHATINVAKFIEAASAA